ncbi:MAG: 2OG-Fe(II) oxygenase [Deltaproteobacteria bacterium]|nr:2OG-Fe(II) oxygenase [Deltaproteobacteria bacterium]
MMWRLGDEAALAEAWRAARPFPHVVVDEAVVAPEALLGVLEEEPVERYVADLYDFDATAPEPTTEAFRKVRARFAGAVAPVLARVTGKDVARADMRAFAYRAGHYLLPHTDYQVELARQLAYAYYLPSPEPPVGGELDLFDEDQRVARVIEPRANRLVVFDVGETTLHQVREVLDGMRLSLAGWFYA